MNVVEQRIRSLVGAHRDVYESLLHVCEALPQQAFDLSTGCPGWRVRDVLAHVVGLEGVLAGDEEPDVEVPDLPHLRNDLGRYMEGHVHLRRDRPVGDLLIEMREVFSRRLGQIENVVSADELLPGLAGIEQPAAQLLSIRVFDLWAHEQDIRRAVAQPGHLSGPAPRASLDRIRRAWREVLPERLGHPDVLLRVAVTGASSEDFLVDLSGGGRRDGTPDVTLTMPVPDLVARACGRDDAPGPDLVLVEGDRPLADRVLDALPITP